MNAAFVLVLACLLAWRPLAYGSPPGEVARYLAFLAVWIVIPGCVVARLLGGRERDAIFTLGMGATLGFALQALVHFALVVSGVPKLIAFHPLAVLALAAVVAAKRPAGSRAAVAIPCDPPLRLHHLLLLLGLCAIAVERTTLTWATTWWSELNRDLQFHTGNAAEFANRWPMRNPRIASLPLNYHCFSYAPAAALRELFGTPISECTLRLAATTSPVLLALQVFNAGRVFGAGALAGLAAAALVLFRADLGSELGRYVGAPSDWLGFSSFLGHGVFESPSTSLGLVYFVTLAILLERWLARGERRRWDVLGWLALMGLAASGTKGSVMPVVVGALGLVAVAELLGRCEGRGRTSIAFAVLAASALPATLLLSFGEQSFAGAMFRFEPGASLGGPGLVASASAALGAEVGSPPWVRLALAPLWIVGYFGLIGVAASAFLWRRRRALGSTQRWIGACALIGTIFVLGFAAPGQSELFFLYNGEVGLAILAGSALVDGSLPRGLRPFVKLGFAPPFVAAGLLATLAQVGRDLRRTVAPPPLTAAYREGLTWIRDRTPRDSVFATFHGAMLVSVHGERATFYETDEYTPAYSARSWTRAGSTWVWRPTEALVFPELVAPLERLFARPDATSIRELRAHVPNATHLYAVFDSVSLGQGGEFGTYFEIAPPAAPSEPDSSSGMSLEFQNEALRIYRLTAARGP